MPITKNWKVAGATAALGGLGLGAVLGLTPSGADGGDVDRVNLRDTRPAATAPAPDKVEADDDLDYTLELASPDGESIDSPLQSPDDSPEGADSVDTPGEGPNSLDSASSADFNSVRSPASVQSVASPEPLLSKP